MLISLVIATFNRADSIDRLVSLLEKQTLDTSLWEVIVVCDGSTDDTVVRLARHQTSARISLRVIEQKNAGQSAARDRGIRLARGKRVVITDDDMELTPDFLKAHLDAAASDPERIAVLGAIHPTGEWRTKPLFDLVGEQRLAELHRRFVEGKTIPQPTDLFTGNVSYPRALYLAVGGFNTKLRVWEDLELGYRLGQVGVKVVFSEQAWTIHHSNIGDYKRWRQRNSFYGRFAVDIWETNKKTAKLHPLANLQDGSRGKRALVLACCYSDHLTHAVSCGLTFAGNNLQKIGLVNAGIGAYKLIEVLDYHLSLKKTLGGWGQVLQAARAMRGTMSQVL